jgi:WD40 repeat protein
MLYAYKTGQFEKHKSGVYPVDNNKQGITVSASENELLFWDKRHCTGRLAGHTEAIKTVAFSHSGQLIASGSIDKSIKIWSSSGKKVIKTLNGHTEGVNKVAFSSSDKYIVSAGYDDKLCIWDWESGNILQELTIKHTNFSINESDVLAYVDTSCNLTLFDLKSLQVVKIPGQFCGAPVFHPQKNIIAVNEIYKSIFTFIDVNISKVLQVLDIKEENSAHEVNTFKFTPDGKYIVAGIWGGNIEIWDWQSKKLIRTLEGHILNSVNDLSFNSNNELISASGDRSLKYWNWNNGQLKMVVGDGSFQAKLNGLLAILMLLTLLSGFWVMAKSTAHKHSSFAILSILTVWSLGIFLVLNFFKSTLSRFSIAISWISTVISGLLFLSVWFGWLAIFTVPIALFFCYIRLLSDKDKKGVYLPLMINLAFCGILCSYIISAGWK